MNRPALAPANKVPDLVRRLYSLVFELEALFPYRKFTLDGHLVGSIGEVIAAHRYELTLHPASSKAHDASATDGRQVQVKATQGDKVALRAEPDHLIVLQIGKDGHATEVFNGPGSLAWSRCGPPQSNGQRAISLSKLREIMLRVTEAQRLPSRNTA